MATSANNIGIVLAAGMGKRMKNPLPKVAHTILGKPLILWIIESLKKADIQNIVVVISPEQKIVAKIIQQYCEKTQDNIVEIAYQEKPLGTGHAASQALPLLEKIIQNKGLSPAEVKVLIAAGDTPAVQPATYSAFLDFHLKNQNNATILGFTAHNPYGYGRILLTAEHLFQEIREEKDCSTEEKLISLCNSGFLCINYQSFKKYLPLLKNDNASQEFYLTDLPRLARQNQEKVGVLIHKDEKELAGINSQEQLAQVAQEVQYRILQKHMENGVQILNPNTVYVEDTVQIGAGAILEPFVYLAGSTVVAAQQRVTFGSRIEK